MKRDGKNYQITGTVLLTNKLGLHARAAAKFVKIACKFSSEVSVTKDGITVDGKSIMGLLTLAAGSGSEIKIGVRGKDAKLAFERLKHLIESKFYED